MRLVIATPLFPPEIGGPASYAKQLSSRLVDRGCTTSVVPFSLVRHHPRGLAHLLYYHKVRQALCGADALLILDTWSTGLPALLAARHAHVPTLVRIGGDVLWESYVARTGELVKLSEFYTTKRAFSVKERCVYLGTRFVLRHAALLVFTTAWQCALWKEAYNFHTRTDIIENYYPEDREAADAMGTVFVAAGRSHPLKNMAALAEAFREVQRDNPEIVLDTRPLPPGDHLMRIKNCYAVLVPSVSEVGSNTVIDAIRYGKPFILSTDTGMRDRLLDAGIFIDPLDTRSIETALRRLLDPIEYHQACQRVRAFSYVHSWDQVTDEFLAALKSVCAS